MKNRSYLTYILILIVLFITSPRVNAQEEQFVAPTIPSFPKCESPQGNVKVSYEQGIHGIVGDNGTYSGSDKVYQLSEDTLIQCFCAPNDGGIQTNWWKVSSLTFEQIEYLQNLGWIYIPNGAEWGLAEAPYVAKNKTLSCKEDKTVDTADDDDKEDEDENEGGRGGILGAATLGKGGQVLGLATTGNLAEIAIALTAGFGSLALAVVFLKLQENE